MGLAPAPLNWFPLAWVALVPLWVLLFGQPNNQPERARRRFLARFVSFIASAQFLLPLLWGMGYHGLALFWITGLHPLTWLGLPWLGSVAIVSFCWLFITLWGAALVIIWAAVVCRFPKLPALSRILLATAVWCALEWVWSLGALYWTSLAYTQSPGNLVILHLGQVSGALLVTGAIVACNGLLAEAWMQFKNKDVSINNVPIKNGALTTQQWLIFNFSFVICLHLFGYLLYAQPIAQPPDMVLKVGIIQGNVPTRIKLSEDGVRRAVKGYTIGYEELVNQGVDAVLTPEGALPIVWTDEAKQRNLFYQAVVRREKVAWLGTFSPQLSGVTQSLLTLTSEGSTFSRFNKIKLVPLGEYIPLQRFLGGIFSRLSSLRYNLYRGETNQRFDTPFGRAIASICYESAFPEQFRAQAADGGQFILTASNLDPYSQVLMAQHQAQDMMRAIETDRWAVRATNTGYSSFVNPHGHIIWRSQPNTYQTRAATIYRRQTQTLYVRWGDWTTPLLVGLAAIVVIKHPRKTNDRTERS